MFVIGGLTAPCAPLFTPHKQFEGLLTFCCVFQLFGYCLEVASIIHLSGLYLTAYFLAFSLCLAHSIIFPIPISVCCIGLMHLQLTHRDGVKKILVG